MNSFLRNTLGVTIIVYMTFSIDRLNAVYIKGTSNGGEIILELVPYVLILFIIFVVHFRKIMRNKKSSEN